MIRVQDQDQLDTKPPFTCNGKSSTNNFQDANPPFLTYGKNLQIVVLANRLCIFALCSSDVSIPVGPGIAETSEKCPVPVSTPRLSASVARTGCTPPVSWLRVSYFSVPVLNDITNIEDKHSTRGNEQRLAQSDLAQKLRGNSERKYDHSKHLQRATDPVA